MIITPFQGEMLASQAIRALRLDNRRPLVEIASPVYSTPSRPVPSFRLPICNKGSVALVQEDKVLDAFDRATAWPLVCLLVGFDISTVLRPKTKFYDIRKWIRREEHLRFCVICSRAQRRDFGTSWWIRDMNLPYVTVCPVHGVPLQAVSLEAVTKGHGFMPHEVLALSKPLATVVNSKTVRQAHAVISLCMGSSLIATNVMYEWINDRFKELHKSVKNSHVHFVPSKKTVSPVSHQKKRTEKEDRLTPQIEVDLGIAFYVRFTKDFDQVIAQLISRSNPPLTVEDNIATRTIDEMFRKSELGREGKQLTELTEVYKRSFIGYEDVDIPDRPELSLAILMLLFLDPPWIRQLLFDTRWEERNGTLSEEQLRLGYYIVWRILHAYRRDTYQIRCFEINWLCRRDKVIPRWGISFLGACMRCTPPELRNLGCVR